jgi:hypothetical protein
MSHAVSAFICLACMRFHAPPKCDHDSTLPCMTCGRPRGYRFGGPKGELRGSARECFRCWYAAQPEGSLT